MEQSFVYIALAVVVLAALGGFVWWYNSGSDVQCRVTTGKCTGGGGDWKVVGGPHHIDCKLDHIDMDFPMWTRSQGTAGNSVCTYFYDKTDTQFKIENKGHPPCPKVNLKC